MRTAPLITPPPTKEGSPVYVAPQATASATQTIPVLPPSVEMDREFIVRNQIAERYIAGRLPIRGTHDFERYCRQHPEFIQELGLAERVHSALRLLEAGGIALPWEAKPRAWWEQLPVLPWPCWQSRPASPPWCWRARYPGAIPPLPPFVTRSPNNRLSPPPAHAPRG